MDKPKIHRVPGGFNGILPVFHHPLFVREIIFKAFVLTFKLCTPSKRINEGIPFGHVFCSCKWLPT